MDLPNFASCFQRFEKGINKGKLPYVEQIQLDILRYLARYDESTKTQLTEILDQPISEISKAVDKLHDKELVESYCNKCKIIIKTNDLWKKHQIDHEKKKIKIKKRDSNQGKTKRFIRLTIGGINVSIEDPLIKDKVILDKPIPTKEGELKKWEPITIENVWDRIYDLKNMSKKNKSIEFQDEINNLFTLYYEKVLKIPNEFIFGFVNNNILDIVKKLYEIDHDFYFEIREPLLKLYTNDKVTWKQTEAYLKEELSNITAKQSLTSLTDKVNKHMVEIFRYNLAQFDTVNNVIKTTHFGLLLVFTYLLEYYLRPNPSANLDKLLEKMSPQYNEGYAELSALDTLRSRNRTLLPLILKDEKWIKLKKYLTESDLLSCFPVPQRVNEYQNKMYDIRRNESTSIETIFHMEERYAENIWNEFYHSRKLLCQKKTDNHLEGVISRFNELEEQTKCHFPTSGLDLITYNPKTINSIQNVISIYFFVKLEKKIGGEKFSKLLEGDEDIRKFWNKWMRVLKHFQHTPDKEFQTYHSNDEIIDEQEKLEIENEVEQHKIRIEILENTLKKNKQIVKKTC